MEGNQERRKPPLRIMEELSNNINAITKKLKKKKLDPEQRKEFEEQRKALVEEMLEISREILSKKDDDWELTIANYMYTELKKKGYEDEKAKAMAGYGIKQLYEIGHEVEIQMQKEQEAKVFFEQHPELVPKKKWYLKWDNIGFIILLLLILIPFAILLTIALIN